VAAVIDEAGSEDVAVPAVVELGASAKLDPAPAAACRFQNCCRTWLGCGCCAASGASGVLLSWISCVHSCNNTISKA
jgi:hypothetical protein